MKAKLYAQVQRQKKLSTGLTFLLIGQLAIPTNASAFLGLGKKKEISSSGLSFTKSEAKQAKKIFTQKAEQCVDQAFYSLNDQERATLAGILNIKEGKMDVSRVKVDDVSYFRPFSDSRDMSLLRAIFSGKDKRRVDQYTKKNLCVVSAPVIGKNYLICQLMIDEPKMQGGALVDQSIPDGNEAYRAFLLKREDLSNPDLCNTHPQMIHLRDEIQSMARSGDPNVVLAKNGLVPPPAEYGEQAVTADSRVSSTPVSGGDKRVQTGRVSVGAGGAGRAGGGSPTAAPLDQTSPPPVPGPATIMPEGGSLETPGGNGAQVTPPSTSASDDGGTVPTTATTTGLTGASTSSSGTATTAAAPGAAPQGNKLGNLVDSLGILGKVGDQFDFIQPRYSENGKRYAVSTLTYDYANGAKEEGLLINEDHFNAISQQAVALPAIDTKSAKSEKEAADMISATVGKIAEKEVSSLSGEHLQKAENDVEVLKVRAASLFAAQMQRIGAIEKKGGDTGAAYAAAEKLQAVVVYYSMKLDMIREKKYSARLGSAPAAVPATGAATAAESSSSTTTRSSAPVSASSSSSGASEATSSAPVSPSSGGSSSPAAVTNSSAPTPPSPSPEPWKSEGHPAGFNISDLVIAGMNNTKATLDSQELRKFVEEADQRVAKEIETKPGEIVAANKAKIAKIDDSIKAKELEIKELEAKADGEYKKVALKKAKVGLASLKYEKGKLAEESEDAVANASKRKKKQLEVLDAMLNPETGVLSYEIENIAAQARIALKSTESDAKVLERIENQNPLAKDDAAYAHVENLRSWYHYVRVRKQKFEYYKGMVEAQK